MAAKLEKKREKLASNNKITIIYFIQLYVFFLPIFLA